MAAGGAAVKAAKAEISEDGDDDQLEQEIQAARIPYLANKNFT